MANVKFTDNSVSVKNAIKEACVQGLHEAGMVVKQQVIDISRYDTTATKGSYDYSVDESELSCKVGSPLENAIWEEFGTGIYAENGNGRKGYWVFVKGNDSVKSNNPKSYSLGEAKKTVAIMRAKGLDAYYTNGKKGKKALRRSFDMKKAAITSRFEELLGGLK